MVLINKFASVVSLLIFKFKLGKNRNFIELVKCNHDKLVPDVNASIDSILRFELWDLPANHYSCDAQDFILQSDNFTTKSHHQVDIDIRQITALNASKSTLENFHKIEDIAIKNSPELIQKITMDAIDEMMNWGEVNRDFKAVTYYNYLQRYVVFNSGGSHHFAAAQYIATRLDEQYKINVHLKTISLRHELINELCLNYDVFIFEHNDLIKLINLRKLSGGKFMFYIKNYPINHNTKRIIFLPNNNDYSVVVTKELILNNCKSINKQLLELSNQHYSSLG